MIGFSIRPSRPKKSDWVVIPKTAWTWVDSRSILTMPRAANHGQTDDAGCNLPWKNWSCVSLPMSERWGWNVMGMDGAKHDGTEEGKEEQEDDDDDDDDCFWGLQSRLSLKSIHSSGWNEPQIQMAHDPFPCFLYIMLCTSQEWLATYFLGSQGEKCVGQGQLEGWFKNTSWEFLASWRVVTTKGKHGWCFVSGERSPDWNAVNTRFWPQGTDMHNAYSQRRILYLIMIIVITIV